MGVMGDCSREATFWPFFLAMIAQCTDSEELGKLLLEEESKIF